MRTCWRPKQLAYMAELKMRAGAHEILNNNRMEEGQSNAKGTPQDP
jgi:hypothetical protein